jgi:hypothetical protein
MEWGGLEGVGNILLKTLGRKNGMRNCGRGKPGGEQRLDYKKLKVIKKGKENKK